MDSWRLLRYADTNSDSDTDTDTDSDTNAYAYADTNSNARFCVQSIQGRHGRCQLEHRRHAKHGNRHVAAGHQRHAVA